MIDKIINTNNGIELIKAKVKTRPSTAVSIYPKLLIAAEIRARNAVKSPIIQYF